MSEEFEDWVDDDYQYTEYLKNNSTCKGIIIVPQVNV